MMKTEILAINDPKALAAAIDILVEGGMVAFPTDTVYGLGALAFDEQAVSQISDVKGREIGKPIPVFINDISQLNTSNLTVN